MLRGLRALIWVHLSPSQEWLSSESSFRGLWVQRISMHLGPLVYIYICKVMRSSSQWWPQPECKAQRQAIRWSFSMQMSSSICISYCFQPIGTFIWNTFVQVTCKNVPWYMVKYRVLRMPSGLPSRSLAQKVECLMPWGALMLLMTSVEGSMIPLIRLQYKLIKAAWSFTSLLT